MDISHRDEGWKITQDWEVGYYHKVAWSQWKIFTHILSVQCEHKMVPTIPLCFLLHCLLTGVSISAYKKCSANPLAAPRKNHFMSLQTFRHKILQQIPKSNMVKLRISKTGGLFCHLTLQVEGWGAEGCKVPCWNCKGLSTTQTSSSQLWLSSAKWEPSFPDITAWKGKQEKKAALTKL